VRRGLGERCFGAYLVAAVFEGEREICGLEGMGRGRLRVE